MLGKRNTKIKLIGVLMLGFVALFGCEQRCAFYPKTMPKDFNFISKINDNSYIVNSYEKKLIKKIDWDYDTIISYQMSEKDKEKIYNILNEIDIYKYPPNYAPTSTIEVSPSFSYQFKFTMNRIEYSIKWEENTESEIKEAKNLRRLFLEIEKTIQKDIRVSKLPESKLHSM